MNTNLFYRELFEFTLGLDVLGLEGRFPAIVKMIESKTLHTFGTYLPIQYRLYLDLTDESNIIRKDHQTLGVEYYLKDATLDKFNLPILDIEQIDYNNLSDVDPYDPNSTAYYSSVIASRNNLTLEAVLMGSEYTYNRTLTDFAMPWKRYHELRGQRTLYLRNYAFAGQVEIVCRTIYPNIASIPEEYYEIFMNLAKLDTKIMLWNELKFIESVVTPTGNLDLKISDWEGAEKERDDYLRELKTKTFSDRVHDGHFRLV